MDWKFVTFTRSQNDNGIIIMYLNFGYQTYTHYDLPKKNASFKIWNNLAGVIFFVTHKKKVAFFMWQIIIKNLVIYYWKSKLSKKIKINRHTNQIHNPGGILVFNRKLQDKPTSIVIKLWDMSVVRPLPQSGLSVI